MKSLILICTLLGVTVFARSQPKVKTIHNLPEKHYTYFVEHAPDSKGYVIGHMNAKRQFFLTKIRYSGSKIWSKPLSLVEKIKFNISMGPTAGGLPPMQSVISSFVHCYKEEVFVLEAVKEGKAYYLALHKFNKAGNQVIKGKKLVSYQQSFFERTPYPWIPYLSGSNFAALFNGYSPDGSKMLIYTIEKDKRDNTKDRYKTIVFDFDRGEITENYISLTNELQYAKFYGSQRAAYGIIDNEGVVYFLEKVSPTQTKVTGAENSVRDFNFKISRFEDLGGKPKETLLSFEGAKWIPDLMIGIDEYGFLHATGNYSEIKEGVGGYVYAKLIAANLQVVAKNKTSYTNSISELGEDIPDFQRGKDARGNRFRLVLNRGFIDGDEGMYLINEESFTHSLNNTSFFSTYPRAIITAIDLEGNLKWAKMIDKRPNKPADVPAGSKRGVVSKSDHLSLCSFPHAYQNRLWIKYIEKKDNMKAANLGYTIDVGLNKGETPARTEIKHTSATNKVASSLEVSYVDEQGLHYIYSTFTSGITYRNFKIVDVTY